MSGQVSLIQHTILCSPLEVPGTPPLSPGFASSDGVTMCTWSSAGLTEAPPSLTGVCCWHFPREPAHPPSVPTASLGHPGSGQVVLAGRSCTLSQGMLGNGPQAGSAGPGQTAGWGPSLPLSVSAFHHCDQHADTKSLERGCCWLVASRPMVSQLHSCREAGRRGGRRGRAQPLSSWQPGSRGRRRSQGRGIVPKCIPQ